MTLEDIDTNEAIKNIRQLLKEDTSISPGLKTAIEIMIFLVSVLTQRLGLNSRNSSKPPSSDFGANTNKKNEDDKPGKNPKRKPGGQQGHNGVTLDLIEHPDETVPITIDRRILPSGHYYQSGAAAVGEKPKIAVN